MDTNSTTNKFIEGIKSELDSQKMLTENGAVAYQTAGGEGKCLVDFNFAVSSMRGWTEVNIKNAFAKAYYENPELALRYWAFCMDCRGGLGERRTGRLIFDWLIDADVDVARKLLPLIPEYGRWDTLVALIETPLRSDVVDIITKQLRNDLVACREGKSFSLLAKWCPSQNTSSPKTRKLARIVREALELTPRKYRKMLSELRKGLKVIERIISAKNWDSVDYNAVPSKANLLYRNAFMKHDTERRTEYLDALKKGDKNVKINSSTAFPCDIVHRYGLANGKDDTLEEMWKALPDYLNGKGNNTLVVADTSGSMAWSYVSSNMTPWSVAQSLAIYFSERASGPFKDKYIMFSSNPFWVDFSNCKNLCDRLKLSRSYNECSTTDIEKTFMLILDAAVNNSLKQEDMPKTVLVVSDMQFDMGTGYSCNSTLFENIGKKFEEHGYVLPKLVFWNVAGGINRTNPVPLQRNEEGIILMSGFSASLMKMALSDEMSPYAALVKQLMTERYDPVAKALSSK